MGTSWHGLVKLGGDGCRQVLVELQPTDTVHNKLVN